MTLTKAEIANKIMEEFSLDRNLAETFVDKLFATVKQGIVDTGSVKVSNFGKFTKKDKSARVGRNPRTGEEYEISARSVVTFAASQHLKDQLSK